METPRELYKTSQKPTTFRARREGNQFSEYIIIQKKEMNLVFGSMQLSQIKPILLVMQMVIDQYQFSYFSDRFIDKYINEYEL